MKLGQASLGTKVPSISEINKLLGENKNQSNNSNTNTSK